MKFYLDFEATDFTDEIISIGCVAETGSTFYRVVIPSNYNNITKRIRKLTGLTAKHIQKHGVRPDIAFKEMEIFVKKETPKLDKPIFYCYGRSDSRFIRNTIKNMHSKAAINFARSVSRSMEDYSYNVQKVAQANISLKSLTTLVYDDDSIEQNHNALEDALMLKELDENFERIKDKIIIEGKLRRIQQEKHDDMQREAGVAKRRACNGIIVGGLDFSRKIWGSEVLKRPSHIMCGHYGKQVIIGGWDFGRHIQWQKKLQVE